jgi:hypothetical protein
MNEVLNFMYTNRCLISLKNAPDLLIAAKRFELEKLKKQIADFLLFRLTVDNAIEMLICAHEAGSEALKLACIRLINRHAEKIKRTEKWKTFKTQYIDLVPELYENRIEHPAPAPQAFLPDVFTAPTFPSESLRSLSQLYENPVQQRLQTPVPRMFLPPSKFQQPGQSQILQTVQFTQPNEPAGPYPYRSDSNLSLLPDRDSPVKQYTINNIRRAMPPIKRTVLPNVRQNSETDVYRRPVNLYEKSYAMPASNQRTVQTHLPPPQQGRYGPPRRIMNARGSPPLKDAHPNDHMTLTRVVSIDPGD